ncbi:MAG: hypothetical protein Q9202_006376 [Teloschistes flavicans]
MLALVGLGGIGKTQVALELAYTVHKHRPEYSIFWVPAISAESFEQACRSIATQCCVASDSKDEDTKESVQRYLSSDRAGKWLLIVDNADDEEILFGGSSYSRRITDYLPQSENGRILFTTRHRGIAVSLARNKVVEVQEMDQEEATVFLTNSLTEHELPQDSTIVTELLNELAFLPLAIAQAAAYIYTNQISIPEYLSLLRSTEQDMVSLLSREFHDDTRYKNSRNSIAATWLVSFDRIRRSDPVAADLLSFMSCIENKAIPRSILPSIEPPERMVHAIGTLRAYAFVTRRNDVDSYDMHRLVHLAIKIWLDKQSTREALSEKVAIHLTIGFLGANYDNRHTWRDYLPHALHFLERTRMLDTEARYDLCLVFGKCLLDARATQAVIWQHELAKMCRVAGQVNRAIKLLEYVVGIQKKALRADHPDRLASERMLLAYQAEIKDLNEEVEA